MFRLSRPGPAAINLVLKEAEKLSPACPPLLSLNRGVTMRLPHGVAHDVSRTLIGEGAEAFAAGRHAFAEWTEFDLGWVRVANPRARIASGELIAIEAHTAGLWSLNISRITETVNAPTRFGFLYATTMLHVEEGQERFVLEYDPASGSVWYLLEAVSRPRHALARLGYPFTRAMQHRFARNSHTRMRRHIAQISR